MTIIIGVAAGALLILIIFIIDLCCCCRSDLVCELEVIEEGGVRLQSTT